MTQGPKAFMPPVAPHSVLIFQSAYVRSSIRLDPILNCFCSRHQASRRKRKETTMQSANIRQIKAALVDQAFTGPTRVSCAIGTVVAVRRRKGQLLAMIRGWGGRWYSLDSVYIVYAGRTLRS